MNSQREERIYQAKRAGLVGRIAHAVGAERAEALMAAWEVEAAQRGLPRESVAFWTEVEPWMSREVAARPRR